MKKEQRIHLGVSTLAVAAIAFACGPAPRPIVHPGAPPPITLQSNASIYDEGGHRVTDATCVLEHDVMAGEPPVRETVTGWRAEFRYVSPPVHAQWAGVVTCSSPHYLTTAKRYEPLPVGELSFPPMKALHAWGDEDGPLHVEGLRIKTATGAEWRYQGASSFKLLQHYCDGRDIDPVLEQAVEDGARVFRVLGMYDPWIGTFTLARDDLPRYDACLIGLVHELRDHGLRTQFVVFADAQIIMPDVGAQLRHFDHISHLLASECSVLGSLANEYSKNGVDPSRFTKPTNTCVLWSRGSGLGGEDPASPPWDFAEYHEARSDDYARKNECRPYAEDSNSRVHGVPCLQEEPIGASETSRPGSRAGAVNGDATQAINDFRQMGANFGLQGVGGLCHSDAGILSELLGPVQQQMCRAFFQGLTFAPPEAHTWPYQRGDNCGNCDALGGMPLEQLDAFELRIFCRGNGAREWCVDVRGTRPPIARGGWRMVAQPGVGLVELAR